MRRAIDILYARDEKLFSVEASEWAIAHRLAIYLEQEIPGWNVDCEYNKQGEGDSKANPIPSKTKKNVRPDIILHHRGKPESEHNLLVLELKKMEESSDSKKARAYTRKPRFNNRRKYTYQFGLALSLFPLKLHWYTNGKEIPSSVSP